MSKTYLLVREEQRGPYSAEQVREMFADGEITAETLYWKEGMPEWKALGANHGWLDKPSSSSTRSIAPPRREQTPGQPRSHAPAEPREKPRLDEDLTERAKPMNLVKAAAFLILFFLVLSALIEFLGLTMRNPGQQFSALIERNSHK